MLFINIFRHKSKFFLYFFCYSFFSLALLSCQENENPDKPKQKFIVCTWGDSLTAGAGGSGTTYPNVLQSLLGDEFQVINCGVGGENAITIAARQGGIPMLLAHSVELPADNSEVIIGDKWNSLISSWNGRVVAPLLQGEAAETVNNCFIDGIECVIRWTGTAWNDPKGLYTIRRVSADSLPVMLNEKSVVFTSSMKKYKSQFANVFFIGQNLGYADNADLVSQYKAMIDFSNCRNYIILGLTSGTGKERAELESLMTKEFGDYYINLREYLATQGLQDAGITPTQMDIDAMQNGEVPPSLLHDHVHFNAKGYELIGKWVYQQFQYLNRLI